MTNLWTTYRTTTQCIGLPFRIPSNYHKYEIFIILSTRKPTQRTRVEVAARHTLPCERPLVHASLIGLALRPTFDSLLSCVSSFVFPKEVFVFSCLGSHYSTTLVVVALCEQTLVSTMSYNPTYGGQFQGLYGK